MIEITRRKAVKKMPKKLFCHHLDKPQAKPVCHAGSPSPFQADKNQKNLALIALIFVAFIALGLPDGLLGVGWPSIRTDFKQPLDALGMLLFASMTGYLISSFFSGAIERRLGVGRVLVFSCMVTGLGLIGYTLIPFWWMMVLLGLAAGLGAGGIDSNLNAYVAKYHGPGLMQWLHASYGIGVTVGPLLMTYFLSHFGQWRMGYRVVGGFQLALALIFTLTLPLWRRPGQQSPAPRSQHNEAAGQPQPSLWQTLKHGSTAIGLLQFFIYTGCEVTLGIWAYSLLTEGRGIPAATAGLVSGSFWGLFAVGRVLAGLMASKINMQKLVITALGFALLGALVLAWNPSPLLSLLAVGLIGFSYAPIFPGLVSATEARVGSLHLGNAVGMQTAAAGLGGTSLASLAGVLARHFGLNMVAFVLLGLIALLMLVVIAAYKMRPEG
ncbi:MAG: MFS transporter [Anaerolineaceae bacterium]|nr:MFS transporter [Anaerolineaceae bacterium]